MLSATHTNLARVAGVLIGAVVAMAVLVAARPGGSMPSLPASVAFTLSAPGTLAAFPGPPARLLDATHLEPGSGPATAGFWLRNQSPRTLRVGIRAKPSSRSLDGLVRVRIVSGAQVLADTTLQGLRRNPAVRMSIRSGTSRRLSLRAWIPADVADGYQGRIVKVTLLTTALPGGGSS